MKYLLLLANDADEAAAWAELSAAEQRRLHEAEVPRWSALLGRMQETGKPVEGLELDLPARARTVRVRGGETLVTDGPYAETREQLGGYLVVDCGSLDEAIELASLVPVAEKGAVEIRPVEEPEEVGA